MFRAGSLVIYKLSKYLCLICRGGVYFLLGFRGKIKETLYFMYSLYLHQGGIAFMLWMPGISLN